MALSLYSGVTKATQTKAWLLAQGQTGVVNIPTPPLRFIGIGEIFGAIGPIGPGLLGVAP